MTIGKVVFISIAIMAIAVLGQGASIMSNAKGDTVIFMDSVVNTVKTDTSYDEIDHAAHGLANGAEFTKFLDTDSGESETAVKSTGNALLYDAQSHMTVKTAPTNQCGMVSGSNKAADSGSSNTQKSSFVGWGADFYTSGQPGKNYAVEMSGNGIGETEHTEWGFKGTSITNRSASRVVGIGNMSIKRSVKLT